MKPELIKIGMFVKYQNQKWVGKVVSGVTIEAGIPEVQVKFQGEKFPEKIDVEMLNVVEAV